MDDLRQYLIDMIERNYLPKSSRKPCLAEEWYVSDNLEVPNPIVDLFSQDRETALRKVYRLARTIRVTEGCPDYTEQDFLEQIALINHMIKAVDNTRNDANVAA
jgi:hypothetical protein